MTPYQFPYLSAHQTRTHEPTDWETELASAIEEAFTRGHHELGQLVTALNASRIKPRAGGAWTPENFTNLMHELGA